MDSRRFDHVTRAVSERGTRRGLLGLLVMLPVLGGLFSLLDLDETAAKGRRKRHKKPHHHRKKTGNRSGNQKKRRCQPDSKTTTCAGGKCGPVKNNCKQTVDCGSCDCPEPCKDCFVCQSGPNTPSACVVDPDQQGEPCGSDGQVCQPDGSCACSDISCGACRTCEDDGTCAGCIGCCDGETCVSDCGDCRICDNGQCTGCPDCCDEQGVCRDGDDDNACGSSGTCEVCTGQEECQSQQCVCVPDCTGKVCGSDGCTSTCAPGCGPNSTCTAGGTLCECDFVSCDDACCADGESCCGTDCVDLQSDTEHCGDCDIACATGQTCQAGVCGVVCGSDFCPAATEICVNGACLPCNVACTGTPAQCGADLQMALNNGGTITVCAGTYRGGFTITKNVTLSGVGDGDDPSNSTILDGNNATRVLLINSGVASVTLRNLRVSGGAASDDGAGIKHQGTKLEMRDCVVAGNTLDGGTQGGGLSVSRGSTLEMTRCTVSGNKVIVNEFSGRGGGGLATGGATTLTDCIVERNNSGDTGGGINVFDGLTKLTGNTEVRRNVAARGGGCYVTGGGGMDIEETCRVTRNLAHRAGTGGGINETQFGNVVLQGADPSPIVVENCQGNCAGDIPKCAPGGAPGVSCAD